MDSSSDGLNFLRNFWQATSSSSTIGLRVVSPRGGIQFANVASGRLFYGGATFDSRGMSLQALEYEPVAQALVDVIEGVIETGRAQIVHQIRDGVLVESEYRSLRNEAGREQTTEAKHGDEHLAVEISREAGLDSLDGTLVHDAAEQDAVAPTAVTQHSVLRIPYVSWGPLEPLTRRQLEVLSQLRAGKSQRQAAESLGVMQKTIETHRDQLVRRLRLSSTLQAIRLADRAGLTLEWARVDRVRMTPWRTMRDDDRDRDVG